ncbi:hypothetical protein D8674_003264 [Pyrus ussuriensis x Pyrus communis]|uniref:Uncharacterized protein n=1 Tax=Pyrus ussuriensis x Pyrus communis TaxID=2448454 RepID=A0A5N5FGK3_9ROSA|nr:hypothetical protein D8674_003264 [Pyrus ussuriensis x Pyrus communis]
MPHIWVTSPRYSVYLPTSPKIIGQKCPSNKKLQKQLKIMHQMWQGYFCHFNSMSSLITRRRSVIHLPPALSATTAPGVSAPLIGEPTPLTEATPTTSQVPISSTSSVSVQPLSARLPKGSACGPERANKGLGRADEGSVEGPGRGDEGLCRAHKRPCTSHTDVWPPNLATST